MTALAYVIGDGRGVMDRLLADVAAKLSDRNIRLAGVVQVNTDTDETVRCDMDLRVLGSADSVRISQRLGTGARACRLDPDGLETAVGLVEATLDGAALLIVNKFGKAEGEGRGFRPLIGQALVQGIPVLVGVRRDNLDGFLTFAQGIGAEIAADRQAILGWWDEQNTEQSALTP